MPTTLDSLKQRRERAAVLAFARDCVWPIKNVASLPTPNPDIFCRMTPVGEVGIEVTECIDEGFARRRSDWIRNKSEFDGGSYSEQFLRMIEAKFRKHYETPLPQIHLLVYVDHIGIPVDPRRESWVAIRDRIRRGLGGSPFSRVWVHSQPDSAIVIVEPPVPGQGEMFP